MKKTTWSRKNFLLVAGLSLIGVHLGSMLVNLVAKKSAQSHSEAKRDRHE
ncbi:uncharacterized LOC128706666 homolog [Malurus melanocephalus]|uniref:Uncharacterized protein n=1 Tax=Malurus cyaneus samueli TaxID=2593467 RepID=A0A8C5X017_9PASS|nr:uncharacterized LOC128706666 homolog [Malurus melanocephalus]